QVMNRQRPTVVLVMAIVNMIAGALAILCGACGIGSAVLSKSLASGPRTGSASVNQAELSAYLNQQIPGYSYIEGGYSVLLFFLGIIVIVAGIGLLWMHRWAWWTSVGYAVFTVLLQIGYVVFKVAFAMPVGAQYTRDLSTRAGGPSSSYIAGYYTGFFLSVTIQVGIFLFHAIALSSVMLLPTISAAFSRD